jgi:hypothetical protein
MDNEEYTGPRLSCGCPEDCIGWDVTECGCGHDLTDDEPELPLDNIGTWEQ